MNLVPFVVLLLFSLLYLAFPAVTSASSSQIFTKRQRGGDDEELATKIGRTFYFESHGRDDRREWRAAFLKGVRVVKIDFNFQSNASRCVQQVRLNPNKSLAPSNFPNGCFVLTHYYDPAVLDYSLPSDLFSFMNDPLNDRDIFSHERTQQSGPVIVQMCLKNKPGNCCPIQQGSDCEKWLRLFDQFYQQAQQQIPTLLAQNRVQFVFDSIGGEGDACYVNPTPRYGNWNSTWTGDLAYAADNEGPHRSQQMPNMDWTSTSSWDSIYNLSLSASAPHWGKFFSESTAYPIIAWEPSNEESIKLYHEWFLQHSVYRPAGVLTAANDDPALFHVFASERTKRFSHAAVGSIEMDGPAVAAPVQSWNYITGGNNNNNNSNASSSISENLANSPLLLRCGSKGTSMVECLFYKRGDHSQFIPIHSTLHSIDSSVASRFELPIRHMIVVGLNTIPSPNYMVLVFDSADKVHTVSMSTPDVTSPADEIPSRPPKWGSFNGCPPQSPFTFTNSSSRSWIVESTGFNHHFSQTNSLVLSGAAIVESSDPGQHQVVVSSVRSVGVPIDQITHGCVQFTQLVAGPQLVVNNVCLNNTDTFLCTSSSLGPLSLLRPQKSTERKKNTKSIHHAPSNNRNVSTASCSISIATTFVALSGDIRSIICYSLDRRVFCSTQTFSPSSGSNEGDDRWFHLTNAIPGVYSIPVLASTGDCPTVAFSMWTAAHSTLLRHQQEAAATAAPRQTPFLIRFGNSFCQNTQLIDDNSAWFFGDHICNMRDAPVTDFTDKTDLQGYLFSRHISDLEREIQRGNQHLHGFATVCNSDLMHGTFDSGSDAGVPLLYPANPSLYDDDLSAAPGSNAFVAVVPLKSLFFITPSFCGSSNPGFGKLRLDAFPLPGMIFNYSATP